MDERWARAATVDDVPAIRRFVADVCDRLGVPGELAFHLTLAAGELCANVIMHGYDGGPGQLEVRVRRTGGRVSLAVRDEAPSFDPTEARSRPVGQPLEDLAPGGLGLHLVRQVVDEVEHTALVGGNEVVVTVDTDALPRGGHVGPGAKQ